MVKEKRHTWLTPLQVSNTMESTGEKSWLGKDLINSSNADLMQIVSARKTDNLC